MGLAGFDDGGFLLLLIYPQLFMAPYSEAITPLGLFRPTLCYFPSFIAIYGFAKKIGRFSALGRIPPRMVASVTLASQLSACTASAIKSPEWANIA